MHEEFHSPGFTKRGGQLEMAQLWVNLPARRQDDPPRYQAITASQIPVVELPGNAGRLRVIAGRFGDAQGPAQTFTELNVWDIRLNAGANALLPVPAGHNGVVAVLGGRIMPMGGNALASGDMALFGTQASRSGCMPTSPRRCWCFPACRSRSRSSATGRLS